MKKVLKKYISLISKIPERHYWPILIFLSLYFVVPYSEIVVTIFALGYFKFENAYRKLFSKIVAPLPYIIRYGGSIIFFLVMIDDTLFYAAIILFALWSGREVKKRKLSPDED